MLFSKKFVHSFWISLFLLNNEIVADRLSENSKIQDFLSRKDLRVYLISLERIIKFSYDSRDDLDLNFSFGLFLVTVNLQPFTIDDSIPAPLRNHLRSLLKINDKTLHFFNDKESDSDGNQVNYKISTFFKNSKSWSRRLKKLNPELTLKGLDSNRNRVYPDWRNYVKNVDDIDKWEPSPQQSDLCMASLAETEENRSKCRVPDDCYKILITGTNFGYGLTHRLLFLLLAHFGRSCTVFSAAQDYKQRRRFCKMMHTEAEYIAYYGYQHVDLMFEQIALCTLDGHTEFLHRSWLTNLLRYQTPYGCFGQRLPTDQILEGSDVVNWKHDVMNGTCNGHVTAVAAASIAAAVRFILESYIDLARLG